MPFPSEAVAHAAMVRFAAGAEIEATDAVAVEEPLAVELTHGRRSDRVSLRLLTTMRTPGHDVELVRGMLLTEGVVAHAGEIVDVRAGEADGSGVDVVRAEISETRILPERLSGRRVIRSSACGVCGSERLDLVRGAATTPIDRGGPCVRAAVLASLPDRMANAQDGFRRTGGMHAAALFTTDGALIALREDVGRHNALDKLIGALASDPALLSRSILALSSRGSFELVQKAWVARIPVVATVGAPTSLAVEAATLSGITLAGFVREGGLNVYSLPERIDAAPSDGAASSRAS